MASITITSGMMQDYRIGGLRADGVTPAPLDPTTSLSLIVVDGPVLLFQSPDSFDVVTVGNPDGTAAGMVGHLHIDNADSDLGPGVRPLSLDIVATVTANPTNDAASVGLTPLGAERPFVAPT